MNFDKVRALDGKFSIGIGDDGRPAIINTKTGVPIPDFEPVFVLRGKDVLVPPTLQHYATLLSVARRATTNQHFGVMAEEVLDHAKLIESWQSDRPDIARMPD